MRVLVLDNYDSFVFNLVQYLGELGAEPVVHRNDALDVAEAVALEPDGVLVSPGPGPPEDAGIICDAVAAFAERGTPVLGVCLGHQAIGHVYGATIVGATELMHGKTSPIDHDGAGRLRRPAVTADGDALPLADDRPGDACPPTSRSRRPRPTARSWACATATTTSRACSSTPRACSPRAATTSCGTSWPAAD